MEIWGGSVLLVRRTTASGWGRRWLQGRDQASLNVAHPLQASHVSFLKSKHLRDVAVPPKLDKKDNI